MNIDNTAENTQFMRERALLRGHTQRTMEETDLIMCTTTVDLRGSVAMNARTEYADLSAILLANPQDKALVSDVDEQLLLKLEFTDPVTITSIAFRAETCPEESCSGPRIVKCYANHPDLDFDDTEALIPGQVIILTEDQLHGSKVCLKGSKFSRCHSAQFFVEKNQKDCERTFLNRLSLWGRVHTVA